MSCADTLDRQPPITGTNTSIAELIIRFTVQRRDCRGCDLFAQRSGNRAPAVRADTVKSMRNAINNREKATAQAVGSGIKLNEPDRL
jgi:hypothetical protein